MLIFYVKQNGKSALAPIVIIDAMSSDDRFTEKEIQKSVKENTPSLDDTTANRSLLLGIAMMEKPHVFSCEYSAQFEHIGIPIGIKTRFSGILKSPPALLVSAFSPTFMTSTESIQQLADALSTIANGQSNITYAAMVVKSASGLPVSRQFIVYSAPLFPDAYGTTTTMVLSGALIDDVMIKTASFLQLDKKSSLKDQLTKFLSLQNPALIGNFDNVSYADKPPATEKLLPVMKLRDLIGEVCLQNKMIFDMDGLKVTFYGQDQNSAPKKSDTDPQKFSFLGSAGVMAWGLGLENYTNIKFKSAIYDCKLLRKITIYNDIKSSFFGGLTKSPSALSVNIDNAYDAWVIRYVLKWSRTESICEITASNNWLMSQFRIDGLLESAIYSAVAAKL